MEVLSGTVDSIVYRSEENGYTIAKIKDDNIIYTIVGEIPHIRERQLLKLSGTWINHPSFGKEFKVEICEEIIPSSSKDIEKYLSSGVIHGIGPITAKKIVNKFGDKTLEILDNDIDKLKNIDGIGNKKFKIIKESYVEQKELKDIYIFFQSHGLTIKQCMKIYKKYGVIAIDVIKENPYKLCEDILGIGFKISDKIAKSIGIDIESPFRIQTGIQYIINEFCMAGNTYMPKDILIEKSIEILQVSKEIIEKNILDSALDNKIKVEKIYGIEGVFTIPYYYCELGITNKILSLAISDFEQIDKNVENLIKEFEKKNNINFGKVQKEAIEGAFENGIEIITGGPGTGKTTIIKCIIDIFEKCGFSVALGAPTGRAAKRMSESTGREAKTIHRMLEMGIRDDKDFALFLEDETTLKADVIIIDEASMIDVIVMNSLLKAIKSGTRFIIVGDIDQLPSVGPGNVLRDLIESDFTKVVRLDEIYRQGKESMIVINAHKINKGEMPILNDKNSDFYFLKENVQENILETMKQLVNYRLPKFNRKWDKLRDIQILTPMRRGVLGVNNLNSQLQDVLNPKSKSKNEKVFRDFIFREGDKVMQIKNNYQLKWERVSGNGELRGTGVFNGDMGFIEKIDLEEKQIFVIYDDERLVVYDFIYLDELELAYAITIHKSQGSEFKVVVMPSYMGAPLLMNRNLLYTGITRAKEMVVINGDIKSLNYMVNNNKSMERYSSLKFRIEEIIADNAFK